MGQVMFLAWCVMFSGVFAGTWGTLIYMLNADAGWFVGGMFFVLSFKIMTSRMHEEEPQHNRRFNDRPS